MQAYGFSAGSDDDQGSIAEVSGTAADGADSGASRRIPRGLTLAVLCITLLIVSLDNTIVNVALPTLVRELHASSSQLQWIVDAYAVVLAGLLLVAGSTGDRFGRKWVFMTGLACFAVGSVAAAFSATPHWLIATRAIMGAGAAMIMPSTLSILTNIYRKPEERARAIGIWSGTSGLGIAIGPIVGGWLLAHYWWGSIFFVNLPLAILGFVAAIWFVPNSRNPSTKRPDPVGALLSIAGMSLLIWGIIEASTRTWSSPLVAVGVGTGLALLAGFAGWERHCSHPMLELSFFRSRRFSVAIGTVSLVIFALMGLLFVATQYLQFTLGYTPLQTGIRIAPIALVLVVVAPMSSYLVRWLGTKVVVAFGMGAVAIGMFLFAQTTVGGSYADVFPAFMIIGFGTALVMAPTTESIMGSVPREEAGVASGTNSASLQLGGALGVAVLGSLLNTRYQNRLAAALNHYPVPTAAARFMTGSLGGAIAVANHIGGSVGRALVGVANSAFVSGMDLAFTIGAASAVVGTILVIALLPARADNESADSTMRGRQVGGAQGHNDETA
jgi:EmrB/QacA subfamily drug resistance transporter